ncbi:MAG: FadR family transcriptional regulator [Streptosporangiaceae bacterium]|nr:FadR family transcriptional regulator [Streptosporangiaceae bacterium]MBV9854417.1 FadR family transcriptional regulator [Streptosporangiaceae bacterium]
MAGYSSRGPHARAVQAIAQRVVSGKHPPGALLDPESLERELDVSRTVVREMLRVLAAKGMVAARPRHGTVVRPRAQWSLLDPDLLRWQAEVHGSDASFLRQLGEVRAIIEPAGARLAARRRTRADLAQLDGALTAMTDAGMTGEAAVEADLRFHRALLVAAHNDLMLPMEAVIETGLRARDRLVHDDTASTDPIPLHRRLLEAVRGRDPGQAEAAMRELLAQAERDVRRVTRRLQRAGGERGHHRGAPAASL